MSRGNSFFASIPPVTKNLIIINFLLWLATFVLKNKFNIDLTDYLGLHYITSDGFNAAQLITYMFMHDPNSIGHVFFNMFSVFIFFKVIIRFSCVHKIIRTIRRINSAFVWFHSKYNNHQHS